MTPNFLSKGGWPKREYDSTYTRELIEEKNLFLPIWSKVDVADVYQYSPILADRIGIKWEAGIELVCAKILGEIRGR